jgi:hypothetical protein
VKSLARALRARIDVLEKEGKAAGVDTRGEQEILWTIWKAVAEAPFGDGSEGVVEIADVEELKRSPFYRGLKQSAANLIVHCPLCRGPLLLLDSRPTSFFLEFCSPKKHSGWYFDEEGDRWEWWLEDGYVTKKPRR